MNIFVEPTVFNIVLAAVAALAGVLLYIAGVALLNRVPAQWLCDYDEEPTQDMLEGKRFIGKPLYILGSLLSGAAFALVYMVFGFSWYSLIVMLLTFVLTMIILSDGKYFIIPDQFAVLAAVLSLIFAYYDLTHSQYLIKNWWSPLVGGISVGLLIIAVNLITMLVAKKDGMGFGDVKLFAAVGIATGFPNVAMALLIAILAAFVLILITLAANAIRKKETENYIPFGPSICIGVFVTIVLHQLLAFLINLYLSIL